MSDPAGVQEVQLGPGDVYFGGRDTRVRTLLGSCVAITLWHPRALIGGMCHYLMPSRHLRTAGTPVPPVPPEGRLSGRYADEAVLILMRHIDAAGLPPNQYQVKIFGGGSQFSTLPANTMDVAAHNVDAGLLLLDRHRLTPSAMHLGGSGHRLIVLELWSGDVWVRHVDPEGALR